jgi:hypothetical protein
MLYTPVSRKGPSRCVLQSSAIIVKNFENKNIIETRRSVMQERFNLSGMFQSANMKKWILWGGGLCVAGSLALWSLQYSGLSTLKFDTTINGSGNRDNECRIQVSAFGPPKRVCDNPNKRAAPE